MSTVWWPQMRAAMSAGAQGVGDEDSPEVVRGVAQRLAVGARQPARRECVVEAGVDVVARDSAIFQTAAALEDERHRRAPEPFEGVVGGDQRHGLLAAADALDDRGQHFAELWGDQQQPLLVELGHDLAGGASSWEGRCRSSQR
ncbi:hypothetical protein NRK68_32355 [Streptomyces yangpuensis]|uniref:Uncharacterized protein n=1 Tax=Streptomyces yangpuensis TaxID=1648182 RepID=A0ABY5Q6A3_9ACTN|nr:hypothetical protein [Streptomyces yangpuensis]UUY51523.1 hypothetical protein NRK68_32355 [Streptomyces yangpuensis]